MSDTSLDLGQTLRGLVPGENLFDRYTLKTILGQGGMGIVWRAFDEHLERDVALKFLPELVVLDHSALDELKRETKRNLELTHHNIVRIYDFAHEAQTACISMEHVDGATLSALRVKRATKVFQAGDLTPLVTQFCNALEYAHGKARIVHRDLKPANLMVTANGQLKITDFGIARSLSDSASMLSMRGTSGTLLYMSPQQLEGERPSALDDIYAFGATFYELLTSKPPFFRGAIETQIREKTPPSIATRRNELGIGEDERIPDDWEQTIAACLAKDPSRRPQSASDLAVSLGVAPRSIPSLAPRDELQAAASLPEPTRVVTGPPRVIEIAPAPAPPSRPVPWRRLTVAAAWVLAVSGLATLLVAGVKSFRNSRAEESNREPAKEWAQTAPLEAIITAFGKGPLLRFEPREATFVREAAGIVHVTLKGSAMTRGALYEGVSNEDAAVLPETKLAEWRKARDRTLFLQQRAGTEIAPLEQRGFVFVRETTAAGKTIDFQAQFKARRNGSDWTVDRVVAVDLFPDDALRGKPITEFSAPAILGTDKANHDRRLFVEAIDKYVAAVFQANVEAAKRFARDGRDADGNPLFPADRSMSGERFAQTRMRLLQSSEVQDWSGDDLQYAINEVFARHGRRFEDRKIASQFERCRWYRPRADLTNQQIEESLSDLEMQNVFTLHSAIVAKREAAERTRQLALQQKQQQEAAAAQQEAVAQAQREQAAALIIGGVIQAILNHRK
ncbi:MAG: protein kinase [Chthoniobacterales bacterium]